MNFDDFWGYTEQIQEVEENNARGLRNSVGMLCHGGQVELKCHHGSTQWFLFAVDRTKVCNLKILNGLQQFYGKEMAAPSA